MKRQIAGWVLSAVCVLALAVSGEAKHGGGGGYGGGCCASCYAAPACAPTVQYVNRQVTTYQPQWIEREVNVQVCEMQVSQQEFKYVVNVPVVTPQKRQVTCYVPTRREVEVPVTICVPVVTNEKRQVTICTPTMRQVEFMYTTYQTSYVPRKVQQTTYQCVPEQVMVNVPVCTMVPVTTTDSAATASPAAARASATSRSLAPSCVRSRCRPRSSSISAS